jgi:hypothetical protein
MINHWWVSRPKRKLNSVPEVLATIVETTYDQEWYGQRGTHLSLETALEKAGLKREGDRRDQTGGGARTYRAWISSLGLIFVHEKSKTIKLTLAGEALMKGTPPVEILKNQVLKYQFPSPFSTSRGVNVSRRFRIQPFRFLLKLLMNEQVGYLTEEEIAKIVIVEAENDGCYDRIVDRIHQFRSYGDSCLSKDFFTKYAPKTGSVNPAYPFRHLADTANTFINWLEYTQLAKRDEDSKLRILDEKYIEVNSILSVESKLIDNFENQENFQRTYGIDPYHQKDTRNFNSSKTITEKIIAEQRIKTAFMTESLKRPIFKITSDLIERISLASGFEERVVEKTLTRLYPHGAIGLFMTEYFEMAFKGTDEATQFEKATAELLTNVFGFDAIHIGSKPLSPDVYLFSSNERYVGIIDNKAISKYTISNDHRNRMIHNYIETYRKADNQLAFFSYIAGGFGRSIDSQIKSIADETGIHGSAMSVTNMIKLVEQQSVNPCSHIRFRDIFSIDREIHLHDIGF